MLTHLSIHHFTIIDHISLSFDSQFTVLTGETGAGKSIIIDAIFQLLGKPSSEALIKSGANESIIEGVFDFSAHRAPSEIHTLIGSETQLILRKVIHKGKSSTLQINGQFITAKQVKQISPLLIQILGQHDQFLLNNTDTQLNLVDEMSDSPLSELLQSYRLLYADYRHTQTTLKSVIDQHDQINQQREFLQFQIDDIAKHNLQPDEDTQLTDIKKMTKQRDQLITVYNTLSSHCGSINDSSLAIDKLAQKLDSDTVLATQLTTLTNHLSIELSDIIDQCQSRLTDIDATSHHDLDELEQRLDIIFRLKTKYNVQSVNQLIDKLTALKQSMMDVDTLTDTVSTTRDRLSALESQILRLAQTIHDHRQTQASKLQDAVLSHLSDLALSAITFKIELVQGDIGPHGFTYCQFLISANPGEPLQPLNKIASGGELSRIMLAIKCATLEQSNSPLTLIFDEIDTGIGGLVGHTIGKKLSQLGQYHQVFCITHLTQVAQNASHHIVIKKEFDAQSTSVTATLLDPSAVHNELERMVGGQETISVLSRT